MINSACNSAIVLIDPAPATFGVQCMGRVNGLSAHAHGAYPRCFRFVLASMVHACKQVERLPRYLARVCFRASVRATVRDTHCVVMDSVRLMKIKLLGGDISMGIAYIYLE